LRKRERGRGSERARESPSQIFRAGGEVKKAASARLYHSISVWREKKKKKKVKKGPARGSITLSGGEN
jgi:hypothetical protein